MTVDTIGRPSAPSSSSSPPAGRPLSGPLGRLTRQWRRQALWADLLWALAAATGTGAVAFWAARPPGGAVLATAATIGTVALLVLRLLRRRHPIGPAEIARHLDRRLPELDESAGLLLTEQPAGLLARRQRGTRCGSPG